MIYFIKVKENNLIEKSEIDKIAEGVITLSKMGLKVDKVIIPTYICNLAIHEIEKICEVNQKNTEALIGAKIAVSEYEDDVKYVIGINSLS